MNRSFFLCSAEQSTAANWCSPTCDFRPYSGLRVLLQMVTLLKKSNFASSSNKSVVSLSGYQPHSTQLLCWSVTFGDLRLAGPSNWLLLSVILGSCVSFWTLAQPVSTPHP